MMVATRPFRQKAIYEAVQVTDDNVDELCKWVGGEPSNTPGYLIAFKVWTGTTMVCKAGDWIVLDHQGQPKAIPEVEFARSYEMVA